MPRVFPTPEDAPLVVPDPVNPRWSYGGSKIAGELVVVNYARRHGFEFAILRYHNVYGPAMGWDHVIPQFIARLVLGRGVHVQGDGTAARSVLLRRRRHRADGGGRACGPKAPNEIFNIGNPASEHTINELVELLSHDQRAARSIPRTSRSTAEGRGGACLTSHEPSARSACADVSLEEGLRPTYDWYASTSRVAKPRSSSLGAMESGRSPPARSAATRSPVGTVPGFPAAGEQHALARRACRRRAVVSRRAAASAACHLAQLGFAVRSEVLFPPDYPYTSGSTQVLRENFADLYEEVRVRVRARARTISSWTSARTTARCSRTSRTRGPGSRHRADGHRRLARSGMESPRSRLSSTPPVPVARSREHGPARVVTATNVFAHILDVHEVVEAVLALLDDDGVFISESHYLGDLVETLQYDTIYHEHLRYYSLTSLRHCSSSTACGSCTSSGFRRTAARSASMRHGSAAFDVDAPSPPSSEEQERGLADEGGCRTSATAWSSSKLELMSLLRRSRRRALASTASALRHGPARSSIMSASTTAILDCVVEITTSKKLGKFLPGTAIPVLDEAKLYEEQPEYALLLSWHIADELIANLAGNGFRGKFVVPLPEPRVVATNGSPP